MKIFELTESLDTVKTLTPEQIANHHGVSVEQIRAQVVKGIAVELEHTTNEKDAREIALDHLLEFPDYYDRLEKVEPGQH